LQVRVCEMSVSTSCKTHTSSLLILRTDLRSITSNILQTARHFLLYLTCGWLYLQWNMLQRLFITEDFLLPQIIPHRKHKFSHLFRAVLVIYCDKFTANSIKYYVCPILSEIGMRRQIVVESNQ